MINNQPSSQFVGQANALRQLTTSQQCEIHDMGRKTTLRPQCVRRLRQKAKRRAYQIRIDCEAFLIKNKNSESIPEALPDTTSQTYSALQICEILD